MMKRIKTRIVKVGNLNIGGDFPIWIQSMTNTKTSDIKNTVAQIERLEKADCEIIRVESCPLKSAKTLAKNKKENTSSVGGRYSFFG